MRRRRKKRGRLETMTMVSPGMPLWRRMGQQVVTLPGSRRARP
jgi:hypothetical protein